MGIFGTALTIYYMSKTHCIRAAELIVQNNGRVTTNQTLEAYLPRFAARIGDLRDKKGLKIVWSYSPVNKEYIFTKESVEVLREYLGVPTIKKGVQFDIFHLL